jgi:hypothetical protein
MGVLLIQCTNYFQFLFTAHLGLATNLADRGLPTLGSKRQNHKEQLLSRSPLGLEYYVCSSSEVRLISFRVSSSKLVSDEFRLIIYSYFT